MPSGLCERKGSMIFSTFDVARLQETRARMHGFRCSKNDIAVHCFGFLLDEAFYVRKLLSVR